MEDKIKSLLRDVIILTSDLDEIVRHLNMENSQFFLDWQDKLNEISVK